MDEMSGAMGVKLDEMGATLGEMGATGTACTFRLADLLEPGLGTLVDMAGMAGWWAAQSMGLSDVALSGEALSVGGTGTPMGIQKGVQRAVQKADKRAGPIQMAKDLGILLVVCNLLGEQRRPRWPKRLRKR